MGDVLKYQIALATGTFSFYICPSGIGCENDVYICFLRPCFCHVVSSEMASKPVEDASSMYTLPHMTHSPIHSGRTPRTGTKVTLVSPLYTTRRVRHKGKMSWKTFIQKESPTRREHLRSASSQTVRLALLLCRRVRNGRKKEERSIKEGRDEE